LLQSSNLYELRRVVEAPQHQVKGEQRALLQLDKAGGLRYKELNPSFRAQKLASNPLPHDFVLLGNPAHRILRLVVRPTPLRVLRTA
jgi:hypothetical protein